jgi:uncharacterized protein (TIGR02246 family)
MRSLLLLLVVTLAACSPFHKRSPLTDAFSRDLRIALPAIAELGESDRDEAQPVLQYIARDQDPIRSEAAMNALRNRERLIRDELASSATGLRAEIAALHVAMEEAFRNGNLLGVAAVYADDAVILGHNGKRVAGRAAIDDYWTSLYGGEDWELTLLDVEGEGGLWIERGRSKITVIRDEQKRVSEVEFVLVWQRQPDGALLIKVDAFW